MRLARRGLADPPRREPPVVLVAAFPRLRTGVRLVDAVPRRRGELSDVAAEFPAPAAALAGGDRPLWRDAHRCAQLRLRGVRQRAGTAARLDRRPECTAVMLVRRRAHPPGCGAAVPCRVPSARRTRRAVRARLRHGRGGTWRHGHRSWRRPGGAAPGRAAARTRHRARRRRTGRGRAAHRRLRQADSRHACAHRRSADARTLRGGPHRRDLGQRHQRRPGLLAA